MELFFKCPVKATTFAFEDYSLGKDYQIVETEENQKKLQGMVFLDSPCPLCGQIHRYRVEEVLCSLTGGD